MNKLFIFASCAVLSLTACTTTTPATATAEATDCAAAEGEIAYIYGERVMAESDLFQSEGVALRTKGEKAQEAWSKKEQGFQYEAAQLQEKYQKGLITTANAQKQQASIESRMRTYQTNAQKEAQTLDEENFVFSNRAQDLFRRAVKELNADRKYKMILDASMVIDADTLLDLTDQTLEIVNKLYAAEKSEKK